jgi:hypothetical protein
MTTVNVDTLQHPWPEACCARYEQMRLSGEKLIFVLFLPGISFGKYLNKSVPVWWVKAFLTPSTPSTFLVYVSYRRHARKHTQHNTALRHLGRWPLGQNWQGPALVTRHPPTGLFKYIFLVTENTTKCTPHISAMPLCQLVLGTRLCRVA